MERGLQTGRKIRPVDMPGEVPATHDLNWNKWGGK